MSYATLNESAAPSTPASGKGVHYNSTLGEPHFVDDNGVDINLAPNRKFNWVRNSGFWFAQRQAPGTLTTYSNTTGRSITADGWGVTNENASVQYIRTDTSAAPETGLVGRFYGSFTKLTSTGKIVVTQAIEGNDTAVLRGSTVRVQCLLKALTTNLNVRVGLTYLTTGTVDTGLPATHVTAFGANTVDPTLGTNMSYLAPKAGVGADGGTISGNGITCAAVTSGWTRFGAVFDVPLGARNLVLMIWSDSQIAPAGGFAVSQVSLTDGQAIQDWAPGSFQQELARVQRLYAKSFPVDTAPAQNAGLAGAARGHVSVAGASASQPIGVRFPVTMRASPATWVFYNPSAANAFARNTTAGTDATATALSIAGDQGADVFFTGIVAWTVAQAMAVHFTADAEI